MTLSDRDRTTGDPLPFEDADIYYRFRAEHGRASALLGTIPRNDDELVALARARTPDPARRAAVVAVLMEHWRGIRLDGAALESRDLLANPATHIVIAGQQPALCGGPLLILLKALSVARLARRLRELGVPAAPLFWIADEDHDVRELAAGAISTGAELVDLPLPFAPGRRSINRLETDNHGASILQQLRALLPASALAREWWPWIEGSLLMPPALGFRELLLKLLQGEGLLPVHPFWLRGLQAPVIRAELRAPGALERDVGLATSAMRIVGLPAPIPHAEQLPFFLCDEVGDRHRLKRRDGAIVWQANSGTRFEGDALEQLLVTAPERFSPDALLRPLCQDYVLEPLCAVLGPTEMGYHCELGPAYATRRIVRPVLMPRLRVQVVTPSVAARLSALGLAPGALRSKQSDAELAPSPAARSLVTTIELEATRVLAELDRVATAPDHTRALRRRAERLARRWRKDVEDLAQAIGREVGTGVARERSELAALRAELFPNGAPGERALALVDYLARYGLTALLRLADVYDPYDARERVVVMPELSE
ncbi:MAG: bacillithiol biosynthesis BshC [Planctomycetota bacterium]